MENILLIVHLILALCLIGVVLLQRSEGGGLGIGGGGGAMTGRAPTTPLGKLTWAFAIAFICTSIALTIVAARNSANSSVLDRLGDAPATSQPAEPELPPAPSGDLLPPSAGDAPALPPRAE
ncbi:MAG: preprotein translocase subunit SecG [Mangrovicoccus sp.]|nr:preprotein translocase subunit SecG [Mangrovicoccus sp.]